MRKHETTAVVGVGVAACAACCAGPILALLAAIGLGTVVGVAILGAAGLLVAVLAVPVLQRHRRRREPRTTGAVGVTLASPRAEPQGRASAHSAGH